MTKSRWKKIDDTGLPPPGMYLFKNEETEEIKRVIVKRCPNGSVYWTACGDRFDKATHWIPYEEEQDAPV